MESSGPPGAKRPYAVTYHQLFHSASSVPHSLMTPHNPNDRYLPPYTPSEPFPQRPVQEAYSANPPVKRDPGDGLTPPMPSPNPGPYTVDGFPLSQLASSHVSQQDLGHMKTKRKATRASMVINLR